MQGPSLTQFCQMLGAASVIAGFVAGGVSVVGNRAVARYKQDALNAAITDIRTMLLGNGRPGALGRLERVERALATLVAVCAERHGHDVTIKLEDSKI